MSDCGTADPPTYIEWIVETSNFPGFASRYCSTPIQMVGTPAAMVTFSFTINSTTLGGSRCGPGITIFAPTMTAAKGRPHALAWNIGTTGRIVSRSWTCMPEDITSAKVWSTVERCE